MSYNLLHGLDVRRGHVDLAPASTTLQAASPDVVVVQEADRGLARSGSVDQVAELGRALDLHAYFAPALLGDPDVRWTTASGEDPGGPGYGVGLLTRWPADRVRTLRLPGGGDGERRRPATMGRPGWDREPRVALAARVPTPTGPLTIATTHLSYLPWRAIRQLRAALGWARAGDVPVVLLGDLNLPVWTVNLVSGSAWRHAGGAPTYPSWRPRLQPDHLLASPGVAILDVAVGTTVASDHLPLIATLGASAV